MPANALNPLDLYDVRASLSEEERMVQDSVARFVDDAVLPIIRPHFENHTFPQELVGELAGLGLLGSSLEGFGCAGMNAVSYGLICQELERGDSGLRSFVSVQSSLCMYPIYTYGSEEQKQRYLPRMARGEVIGAFGLTEPHGGSDPANMKTHAKRRGGDWALNGGKMWITNSPIADVFIIWARTEEGIRGFLVDRGTQGPRNAGDREQVLAARVGDRRDFPERRRRARFGDAARHHVRHQGAALVPDAGPLRHHLGRDRRRAGVPKEVLEYSRTRILFNRPLAATQAIQIRLAEMSRKITLAQLLSLQLGRLKDQGLMSPSHVSLAKWNNCRAAIEVARDARDILGGSGISAEYVPIRHALNLESVITYEGTETIHQLTIGRELTGINAF